VNADSENPSTKALKITQERLAMALDAGGGVGIWEWDVSADRVYADARFAALFSVDPARAAAGAPISEFLQGIHAQDRIRVGAAIDTAVQTAGQYAIEFRLVQLNGVVRWVHARGRCHVDPAGISTRFPGVVFDITERKQTEMMLVEKAHLASLSADVGIALAQTATLQKALQQCAAAIVNHLDAAFARVWTLDSTATVLELQASAGLYTHLDGPHARVPVGSFKIGLIAKERKPHLTNDVMNDPRVSDREWAKREGMIAFAGYPLIVEGRLAGVLALFARRMLADDTMRVLESVSTTIAIGIERKRTEAALQESEERYRFLAESMPQMVWTATQDGSLNYVSAQTATYFGVPSDALLGAGWLAGVHPEDIDNALAKWLQSLTTGDRYEVEFRLKRGSDGTWRWFLARAHSMTATGNWVGTCTDIHEQKLGQEALTRANRELEEFAYVASHDLQEPLRMVNIYTQMLLKRLDSQDAVLSQYAGFVSQGVKRMEQLLRDLLTFSRSVHTDALTFGSADLAAALNEALAVLKTRIEETGAVIKAQPLPETRGEAQQLAHVFQNLISNSLKYRANTRPEIDISAERKGEYWIVSVKDNGIGFESRYAEQIFGLFKRLHKDEYPGTGLGLAICQRIVERYGGRMWAESEPGKGSVFYFSLPAPDEPSVA